MKKNQTKLMGIILILVIIFGGMIFYYFTPSNSNTATDSSSSLRQTKASTQNIIKTITGSRRSVI